MDSYSNIPWLFAYTGEPHLMPMDHSTERSGTRACRVWLRRNPSRDREQGRRLGDRMTVHSRRINSSGAVMVMPPPCVAAASNRW